VFCEIIEGTRPAHVVLDNEHVSAFLDAHPLFHGHTLVVPKAHHVTLPDLPPDLVGPFFGEVRRVSQGVLDAFGAAGSLVAMNNTVSQSVPHLHAHVVPRNRKDGLRGFFWPRTSYDDDHHAEATAKRLRAAIISTAV